MLLPKQKVLSINGSSITGNEDLFQALSAYLDESPYLQGNSTGYMKWFP